MAEILAEVLSSAHGAWKPASNAGSHISTATTATVLSLAGKANLAEIAGSVRFLHRTGFLSLHRAISNKSHLEGKVQCFETAPRFRMLRITIDDKKDAVILRLEGELIGPWIQEVEQCWKKVFAGLGERSVHVDLSAVSFVDTAGGALLSRMHDAGFRLAGGAATGQAWNREGCDLQAGAN